MKRTCWLMALALAVFFAGCGPKSPTSSGPVVIVLNAWDGSRTNSNEPTSTGSYGFYIQPYPGSSLSSVILWMTVNQTGSYNYNMSATDTSNGHSVGNAATGAVSIPADSSYHPVTFTFGGNPGVNKGDQIYFTVGNQSVPSGSYSGFYEQSYAAGNTNVVATGGNVNDPLGTGVAIAVYGNN
jgi:hypothetical protein